MKIFGVGSKNKIKEIDLETDESILEEEKDSGQIALDIVETPEKIIIIAPIAGLELEEIDLILNKSVLVIKGERRKPYFYSDEENKIRNSECYWGKFSRNIILPENLDFDKIKAIMENNLLQVSIPKLYLASQNIKIDRIGENF